jgi:hypothetical protein
MTRSICSSIFVLLAVVLLARIYAEAQDAGSAGDKLTITQPSRDGMSAGCRVNIQGRAVLRPGEHAWAFAARTNFSDLGLVWLQGEVEVDPTTHEYSLPVALGIADDVGSSFRVSVGIVDESTNNKLRNKLMDMMTNNRHLPVPFPQTVSAPKHRTVKKVSHEGC